MFNLSNSAEAGPGISAQSGPTPAVEERSSPESMEGTRARRAVPSQATERRAWGGAVDPRGRSAMGSDRGSGAVFEAPALVAGFENVAVMGQAIEQRRRHLGVAEYARPFGEGEICRQNDRGALVKAADQVEQHLPAADREWQVTQLVEDDEIDADELIGEAPGFSGTRFGLELIDQVDCGEEPNARAVAHAIGADRYRYMALAGAGRGRDIVPDTRGRTRRFTTLFIRIAGGELQLCGVIRSAASRCW
jgi:hypothetical protein